MLTMEGVLGAESYKGDVAVPITPAHNATLPFTRNAIGSMDYTPVTFSTPRRQTSAAHELALSVVFESGPAALRRPARRLRARCRPPRRWLRGVPVAWDDTKLLDGYPGRARRRSPAAPAAAGTSGRSTPGAGGAVRLPLDFLYPGRRYRARIVEDAPGAALRVRSRRVTARRVLRLDVGPAGGYVVRFKPLGR